MDEVIVLFVLAAAIVVCWKVLIALWLAFLFACCVLITILDSLVGLLPQRKYDYESAMRRHRISEAKKNAKLKERAQRIQRRADARDKIANWLLDLDRRLHGKAVHRK